MIWNIQFIKPKFSKFTQNFSFFWDVLVKFYIKCRHPVGEFEKDGTLIYIIKILYLATREKFQTITYDFDGI